jgi:hypothetical protein
MKADVTGYYTRWLRRRELCYEGDARTTLDG